VGQKETQRLPWGDRLLRTQQRTTCLHDGSGRVPKNGMST